MIRQLRRGTSTVDHSLSCIGYGSLVRSVSRSRLLTFFYFWPPLFSQLFSRTPDGEMFVVKDPEVFATKVIPQCKFRTIHLQNEQKSNEWMYHLSMIRIRGAKEIRFSQSALHINHRSLTLNTKPRLFQIFRLRPQQVQFIRPPAQLLRISQDAEQTHP